MWLYRAFFFFSSLFYYFVWDTSLLVQPTQIWFPLQNTPLSPITDPFNDEVTYPRAGPRLPGTHPADGSDSDRDRGHTAQGLSCSPSLQVRPPAPSQLDPVNVHRESSRSSLGEGLSPIASYPWVSRGSLTRLLEGDRAVVSFFFSFLPIFFFFFVLLAAHSQKARTI